MPLYEFLCKDCNIRFEEVKEWKENLTAVCPQCGGQAPKIISTPALETEDNFSLKGKIIKKLGEKPIQSRKDFKDRCKATGMYPMTQKEVRNMM